MSTADPALLAFRGVLRLRHVFAAVEDLGLPLEAGVRPAPDQEATMTQGRDAFTPPAVAGRRCAWRDLRPLPRSQKAPMAPTQALYFDRFRLGNFQATIVSDGSASARRA